jgi:hypothetical protein
MKVEFLDEDGKIFRTINCERLEIQKKYLLCDDIEVALLDIECGGNWLLPNNFGDYLSVESYWLRVTNLI